MLTLHSRDTMTWIADHDPLPVTAWSDPLVELLGHDARSRYVETYWLPIAGPSSIWVARRLVDWLDTEPDGVSVDVETLARTVGVGTATGRQSPIVRTLARLVHFGIANVNGDSFAVRTHLAPLPGRHRDRLPTSLARSHRAEFEVAR